MVVSLGESISLRDDCPSQAPVVRALLQRQSSVFRAFQVRSQVASCASPALLKDDSCSAKQSFPTPTDPAATKGYRSRPSTFSPLRLCSEFSAAICAGFCVAPFVTIIDRSIVLSTNNTKSLGAGVREGFCNLFHSPFRFLLRRDFRIVWGVYTATYLASNLAEFVGDLCWPHVPSQQKQQKKGTSCSSSISVTATSSLPARTSPSTATFLAGPLQTASGEPRQIDTAASSPFLSSSSSATVSTPATNARGSAAPRTELLKFFCTSLANIGLCVRKDMIFAQIFSSSSKAGTAAAPVVFSIRSFPPTSTLLFVMRDALTIFASFNAPKYISAELQTRSHAKQAHSNWSHSLPSETAQTTDQLHHPSSPPNGEDRTSRLLCWMGRSSTRADTCAQLLLPIMVQFISTPLHLLALDIFNRKEVSGGSRMCLVAKKYASTVFARICRIGPAFGFGGIMNTRIRKKAHALLASKEHGLV